MRKVLLQLIMTSLFVVSSWAGNVESVHLEISGMTCAF